MTTPISVDEKFEFDSTSYKDEKKEYYASDEQSQVAVDETAPSARHQEQEFHFTWRSAIVGSLLGCLVGKFILHKKMI